MRRLLIVFAAVLIPALATPAFATVYLPAEFAEMVAASRFIVHGTVVDVRSNPTADRRTIATHVTVAVADALKGSPGEAVTFRVPGGQVGRYRRLVVGAPEFDRGDEVVIFLTARGPSIPYLFGLSQGAYRISRAGGSPLVTSPSIFDGHPRAGALSPIVRGDPARTAMPLAEFTREVRAIVERAR